MQAELREREEKKRRDAQLEEQRKKEEAKLDALEKERVGIIFQINIAVIHMFRNFFEA